MKMTIIIISIISFIGAVGLVGCFRFKGKFKILLSIIAVFSSSLGLIYFAINTGSNLQNSYPAEIENSKVNINKQKRPEITNDLLSNHKPNQIYDLYTNAGQESFNKLYGHNTTSRDFALSLIGKTIPSTQLVTVDNNPININKRSIILIVNTGDKSTDLLNQIKNTQIQTDTQYLIVFPNTNKADTQNFMKPLGINNHWNVVSEENNQKTPLQPDLMTIVKDYFNVSGVPSYVSINDSRITLAGTGTVKQDSFQNYINQSFQKPFIYDMLAKK